MGFDDRVVINTKISCGRIIRFNKSSEEITALAISFLGDSAPIEDIVGEIRRECKRLAKLYGKKYSDC